MNEDRICCDLMRTQLKHRCEQHPNPYDCPNVLVIYNPRFDEYGMPIRDGCPSSMFMRFCPWCGASVPESKRDLWFKTLAETGIDEPIRQGIPIKFESDDWWRSQI